VRDEAKNKEEKERKKKEWASSSDVGHCG